MKTLPAAIIAGIGGDSDRVILIRIIPESGDTWAELCWATKDITVLDWESGGASKSFAGGVLAGNKLGTIRQSVDIEQGGNVATVSGLTIRVLNPEYNGTDRFDQSFTDNLENRKVEIRRVFWPGSSPAWSDTLLLYEGVVEDVDYDHAIYKIKVQDAGFKRHKDIPDLVLNEVDYPNVPDNNMGAIVPLLYGAPCFGNSYFVDDFKRSPAYKSDRMKEEYLISTNQSSDVAGEAYLLVYFSDINRWGIIYLSSGSFTIDYGRPTKISFPLDIVLKGKFYSQGEKQGSQTNPTSIDFGNAVDNDLGSYCTLTGSQLLYVNMPMPDEWGKIVSGMTTINLRVQFGTITGTGECGRLKYYDPETDAFSGGEPFDSTDSASIVNYTISALTWENLRSFEFGITMAAGGTAQVRNIWIEISQTLVSGIVTPPARTPYITYHTTWTGEFIPGGRPPPEEHTMKLKSPLMLFSYANGERFGAWIDADSRDNGYNQNHIITYGAYIIETILRSELGLTSSEINYDAFDVIGNDSDGDRKLWTFAIIIEEQRNSLETIRQFCKESALVYYQDYQNKESILALKKKTAIKTIDRTTIREGTIKVRLSRLTNIYNEFYVHYAKDTGGNYTELRYLTASAQNLTSNARGGTPNTYTGLCSDSQSKYGITKRFKIECDWIRDDATANTLLLWLAEWHCYRKYIVEFQTDGLDHINLELGEQVKIDHTLLPAGVSDDASFVVFDIKDDLDNDRMTFECMQVPDLLP